MKRVIRTGSGSSGTAKLQKVMNESFSELTLKDTLKPVLIPCYYLKSSTPFRFSRADALETDGYDFRLWEVCRATWTEPGVFEPVEMKSVDGRTNCVAVGGGLAMSNPTAAAITHVLQNTQEFSFVRGVEDLLVLSLSMGQLLDVTYDYVILQFLDEQKFKESGQKLEQESGYFFNLKYYEEKALIGEWDEVEKYLSGFTKVDDNRYSMKIFFEIRNQKYIGILDR